ncbi:MAG TPA: hypothetical protein VF810_05475, partial [Patescibacteria group bacterium]
RAILDESHTPNSMIRGVAQERAQYYRDRLAGNLSKVQSFLGFPRPTVAITGSDEVVASSSDVYTHTTTPVYGLFYEAFTSESRALGIDPTTIEGGAETIGRLSDTFSTNMYQRLTESFGRFSRLANNFGNPEVLRTEAADAGRRKLEDLADRLSKLGDKPGTDTARSKLRRRLTGSIEMGQEQFDRLAEQYISRFGEPNLADLLSEYVQSGMLHYMRQAFGETPLVLDRGFESDPKEFFDYFQQREGTPLTRPLFPSEILRDAMRYEVNDLLYGADSPISQYFDSKATGYQKTSRDYRKRAADSFSQRTKKRDEVFDPFTGTSTGEGQQFSNIPGTTEAKLAGLNSHYIDVWVTFDRYLSALPLDEGIGTVEKIEEDFINRLKVAQASDRKSLNLNEILKKALVALSPDRQGSKADEIELFKYYVWIRDVANPKVQEPIDIDFK